MEVDVGIVAQRNNERAQHLAGTLVDALEGRATCVVDEETGTELDLDCPAVDVASMTGCDLVVSIGGDGTFLFVARETDETPIVGVNCGEVGFLNPTRPADAIETVRALVDDLREGGRLPCRDLTRVRATGDGWTLESALNEIVVQGPHRGHGGGITVDIRVDGERYTESHADGVLVATPTGSTAYNLSEGGPLVVPRLDAFTITQMCSCEPMPPLVVPTESEIHLRLSNADTGWVVGDGRNRRQLEVPSTVTVTAADNPVPVASPAMSFFDALEKLE